MDMCRSSDYRNLSDDGHHEWGVLSHIEVQTLEICLRVVTNDGWALMLRGSDPGDLSYGSPFRLGVTIGIP